jgi:hypothetical protein
MRYIKQIERPSQVSLVFWWGSTELLWNEEAWAVHYGEDGPGVHIETTRQMFIQDQCMYSGEFQPWAIYEHMDMEFQ